MNQKTLALFIGVLVAVSSAAATQADYCNYVAKGSQRYATQYSQDLTTQRCSFCQYTSSGNTFQSGCSVCPNYGNGQCTACASQYVATQANICIPCGPGVASCCTGNNATTDPNYTNSANAAANPAASVLTNTYTALQTFTGTRQVTCQENYYAVGHACNQIPTGCATMAQSGTYFYCSACKTGYYFDNNNKCVSTCNAYYSDSKQSKACSSCVSASVCSTCQAGYYLVGPSSAESTTDNTPTAYTLQNCNKCLDNCISCTNKNSCTTCMPKYYYGGAKCNQCTAPTTQVTLASGTTIEQYYTACNGDDKGATTSYTFVTSIPASPATDTVGLPANRPIVKLADGTITVCGPNCTACSDGNNAQCSTCQNGYFLNPKTFLCSLCPFETPLCQWSTLLTDAQNPQILACPVKAATDLNLPYTSAQFLQYSFTTANFGDTYQKYDNSKVCIVNIYNCKTMVDDFTKPAICATCYSSAADFPVGLSATPNTSLNYYIKTTGGACRLCNFQGAAACQTSTADDKQLEVATCGSGFKPTVNNNKACDSCSTITTGCTTCSNTQCNSCNTAIAFTQVDSNNVIVKCLNAYDAGASNVSAGCTNWGSGQKEPDTNTCSSCATGFTRITNAVVDSVTGISLCLACPDNCTSCSADNRTQCTTCASGYYLSSSNCLKLPVGCATFNAAGANGGTCAYCQYGYRQVNDQFCTRCDGNDNAYSGSQWFDCPQAQCAGGSSDDPSSSSESSSTILSIISLSLLVLSLIL